MDGNQKVNFSDLDKAKNKKPPPKRVGGSFGVFGWEEVQKLAFTSVLKAHPDKGSRMSFILATTLGGGEGCQDRKCASDKLNIVTLVASRCAFSHTLNIW